MPPDHNVDLKPENWFLTEEEIKGARGGITRDLAVFTKNNWVHPLVDGADYFRNLHGAIGQTGSQTDDFIHLAGWQLNHDQGLLSEMPGTAAHTPTQIGRLLKGTAKQGTQVRVLLSGHGAEPVIGANTKSKRFFDMELPHPGLVKCTIDARHSLAGSRHQKFVVIRAMDRLTAFCGGIDIAHDRWDTVGHAGATAANRQKEGKKSLGGWHDVHCQIQGPACDDLERTFTQRWNLPTAPNKVAAQRSPPITNSIPGQYHTGSNFTHCVQVLRTYSCEKHSWKFALKGEFTGRAALLKAINKAKNYIYIEDQYFVAYEIAEALKQAVDRGVYVIVVVPHEADTMRAYFQLHQYACYQHILKAAYAAHRFAMYDLQNQRNKKYIYVHSKMAIIDDAWAMIGSMNLNRRSMTFDAELGVAVVDTASEPQGKFNGQPITVGKLPLDLRISLWCEHLGFNKDDATERARVVDPVEGFKEWKSWANIGTRAVQPHKPERPSFWSVSTHASMQHAWLWNYIDKQGLCPPTTLQPQFYTPVPKGIREKLAKVLGVN
jgi:phosphatidylserine/phosphatidylglycerophosphate/cardiolipin synthase-like enzyme